ncbi:hybrid sensor histidine kinase/response regulator [Noviherbaspirillum suwonense]|jgi:PAS domain S-box-containing protein|uniref:histidine kinase n=1 Tax=Noviherbaspirillum suwonense TaxID=1224511 RepID=A0ABY1QN76_9BURK|nr:ATP-binding protein [Noviherbaspirillum suwonense]SMP75642.1 PAS domain S-box-containing protein [Noviherbaspirillum suwonense]
MQAHKTETGTSDALAELAGANELEIYRRIFYASPDYIAFSRLSDGCFIDVNPGFERMLGFRREDVIGKTSYEVGIWPESGADQRKEYARKLLQERAVRDYPGHLRTARGTIIDVEASANIVQVHGEELLIAIVRDVTERNRATAALHEADRRKDEFLAMLAHELRNPIAPISMAAQLLMGAPGDEVRVRQISQVIARQVGHMVNLVDDLLDVSRVTRGLVALEQHALDLNALLPDAVEQVRPLMDARRHTLVVQPSAEPACICADRLRIVQIAANLLTNAAKYTPEGGHVTLAVRLLAQHVELTVSDNGIGIAPELLPRVFDLFTQAERSPDRSQGGLGLGLALVKSLTELHKGTVAADSGGIGQGSVFSVRLPRLDIPIVIAGAALQPPAAALPARALRILLVDDNVDAADTLAAYLSGLGHEVDVRYDARSALDLLDAGLPDAGIFDIGLPEIDGCALARQLRARPGGRACRLLALSGYGQDRDQEDARRAGFDRYFVKPLDTGSLAALLAQWAV